MAVKSKSNVLRQIRIIIYRLKRNYGLPAILRRPTQNDYNIQTGETTRTYESITIKRMILLPRRNISDFVYDLSFIAANKNFTYGGYFDTNERWAIIDVKDLPTEYRPPDNTLEVTTEFNVVIESRQYDVNEIILAEHFQGYLLRIREIVGSDSIT